MQDPKKNKKIRDILSFLQEDVPEPTSPELTPDIEDEDEEFLAPAVKTPTKRKPRFY